MLDELINQIRKAEEEANARIADARSEARDIVKGVESAILETERELLADLRKSSQSQLELAQKDFENTLKAVFEEKKNQQLQEISKSRQNLVSAAQYIVKRVMNDGNS